MLRSTGFGHHTGYIGGLTSDNMGAAERLAPMLMVARHSSILICEMHCYNIVHYPFSNVNISSPVQRKFANNASVQATIIQGKYDKGKCLDFRECEVLSD